MSVLEDPGKAIAGVAASIAGGAYAFFAGMLTLDPSFLAQTGTWFPIASVFSRFIGPELLPSVPWDGLFLMASVVFVLVSFAKIYQKRNNAN